MGGSPIIHTASGPTTSLSLHLACSSITPVGSLHKSRGDNVCAYVGEVKEMMCVLCVDVTGGGGGIVVMDVSHTS